MTENIRGRVTWFEIASTDVARSEQFYRNVFGWSFDGDPQIYLSAPAHDGGIAGGLIPATPGVGAYATFGVEVDDVDEVYAVALRNGATSVVEPTDNPGGVRSAYLRDADGSLFAVYRFGSATT